MAGFSSARFSVGNDSASDGVIGASSKLLRGDEHDDDPLPIFEPTELPSLPDSMPESVGLSSLRFTGGCCCCCCMGRVTAVIVVPAGMLGWEMIGESDEFRCCCCWP